MTFNFLHRRESKFYRFFHHFLVSRWEEENTFFYSRSRSKWQKGGKKRRWGCWLALLLGNDFAGFLFVLLKKFQTLAKIRKIQWNLGGKFENCETFHLQSCAKFSFNFIQLVLEHQIRKKLYQKFTVRKCKISQFFKHHRAFQAF